MIKKPPQIATKRADKVMVRLHDEGMRKMLKVRAATHERTLNAEIVYLLKRGLVAEAALVQPTSEALA